MHATHSCHVSRNGCAVSVRVYRLEQTEGAMAVRTIVLKLNQQQLELIDRTIAKGAAPDRKSLIRRAIREHVERHAR